MDDEIFLGAAIEQLSKETRAAAAACASAAIALDRTLVPREITEIAKALGARPAPVLAVMGWLTAKEDRPNRRAYYSVFNGIGKPNRPTDREVMFGLAICKTVARQASQVQF
ncbi:MAG: hypothetical protein AAF607_00710 [Pseudomonadota bacterium]